MSDDTHRARITLARTHIHVITKLLGSRKNAQKKNTQTTWNLWCYGKDIGSHSHLRFQPFLAMTLY